MTHTLSYRIGKLYAKTPRWLKLVALFAVIAYFLLPVNKPSPPAGSPARLPQTQVPGHPGVSAQQRQAAELEQRRTECTTTIEDKKRAYMALAKAGKHWEAAVAIRMCAMALGTPELQQLVKDAEIKAHLADINNPKTEPRDKARAMQMLARDYPEVGAKYEPQIQKLLAEADRKQLGDDSRRKRSEAVIDTCLQSGDCAFQVWGAAAGPAMMSFWVLEREWKNFTDSDKDALRRRLDAYLVLMRENAENYASNSRIGAGIPRSAPAFSLAVQNIRAASDSVVFLSPGRTQSGALIQGRELRRF